jgi:thiopeptide-type bacteriocin biosynthesis protein
MYQFLCALQNHHEERALRWSWGPLERSPFLPRVTHGRVVLSLARWNLTKQELVLLGKSTNSERFRAAQKLRELRALPRWIALADGDNVLPFDLDNCISVDSLVAVVSRRDDATLVEVFPAPDELPAMGPEGRFTHEIVVPFVRNASPRSRGRRDPEGWTTRSTTRRSFAPGSEWLYAKLFGGTGTADLVLMDVIAPLLASQRPDRWFFIRFGDPHHHVRVRIRGGPRRLVEEVLPQLYELAGPLLDDGRITKLQLDTYDREIERYGGPEGIELAEAIFEADSWAVLAMIEWLDGDAEPDARWRLAIRGMHLLLLDLGLDLAQRVRVIQSARARFGAEHHVNVAFEKQLGTKFRAERLALEALLSTPPGTDHPLDSCFALLADRSEKIGAIAREFATREAQGCLGISVEEIAGSVLHMHANRLLRYQQRSQELVLYDFLSRLYRSEAVRANKGQKPL